HAAGGAGQPVPRARAGQRAHDGGRRPDDAAGPARVPRAAALLHPGTHTRQRQGMRAGFPVVRHALTALALVLGALGSTSPARPSTEVAARVLDGFEDV